MNKEKFYIIVEDISKLAGRTVLYGESNRLTYKGKLGNVDAYPVITDPIKLGKAFVSVFGGAVENIKIGDTLYGQ